MTSAEITETVTRTASDPILVNHITLVLLAGTFFLIALAAVVYAWKR